MYSRYFMYYSKPEERWHELKVALDRTRFLLLATVGPTVFNVRQDDSEQAKLDRILQIQDEDQQCFRVTIGNPHWCTCSSQGLCIHMLFVILKVILITCGLLWR